MNKLKTTIVSLFACGVLCGCAGEEQQQVKDVVNDRNLFLIGLHTSDPMRIKEFAVGNKEEYDDVLAKAINGKLRNSAFITYLSVIKDDKVLLYMSERLKKEEPTIKVQRALEYVKDELEARMIKLSQNNIPLLYAISQLNKTNG